MQVACSIDPVELRDLALLGMTDVRIARRFGMTPYQFRVKVEGSLELKTALRSGRERADVEVVSSLLKRAIGYDNIGWKVVMVDGVAVKVDTVQHVPGDVGAALAWLRVRRPEEWGEERRVEDIKEDVVRLPEGMSMEDRRDAVVLLNRLLGVGDEG